MQIWIAVYHHRFGTNAYLFPSEPTIEDVVARISAHGEEFEPDRETIDIVGPETLCLGVAEMIAGKTITAEDKAAYIESGHCPKCGERGTVQPEGNADWDAHSVTQRCRCENCDTVLNDLYVQVDVTQGI